MGDTGTAQTARHPVRGTTGCLPACTWPPAADRRRRWPDCWPRSTGVASYLRAGSASVSGPVRISGNAMEDALHRARKACRPDVVEFDDDEEGQERPAPGTHQPSRGLAQRVIVRLGQRCPGAPGGAGCARRRRGSGAHRAGLTRTASRAGGLGFVGPEQCLCGPRLGLRVVVPQDGEHDRWSHPGSPEPRHTMPLRLDRLRAGVDIGSADGCCRSGWVGP